MHKWTFYVRTQSFGEKEHSFVACVKKTIFYALIGLFTINFVVFFTNT
jgi:hypothetical protein